MKWYMAILAALIISFYETNKQSGFYVKKNMETWYVYVSCLKQLFYLTNYSLSTTNVRGLSTHKRSCF